MSENKVKAHFHPERLHKKHNETDDRKSHKYETNKEDSDIPQQMPWLNPNEVPTLQRSDATPRDAPGIKVGAKGSLVPGERGVAEVTPDTARNDVSPTTVTKNVARHSEPSASEIPVELSTYVAAKRYDRSEVRKYDPGEESLPSGAGMSRTLDPGLITDSPVTARVPEPRPGAFLAPGLGPNRLPHDEELGDYADQSYANHVPFSPMSARDIGDKEENRLRQMEEPLREMEARQQIPPATQGLAHDGREQATQVPSKDDVSRHRCFDSVRSKRGAVVGAILAVIAVLAVVIVVVVLVVGGGENQQIPSPTDPPTNPPTSLMDMIAAASPDQGDALKDYFSPQSVAFTWLEGNSNLDSYTEEQILHRYALAVLFYSTSGAAWITNHGWLTDRDECDWYSTSEGDVCFGGPFKVLNLTNNNLKGTIPPELSLLSDSLDWLDLSLNWLSGSIPSEIASMTNLGSLDLMDNELTGSLPSELGLMTSLIGMNLGINRLSGSVPSDIASLSFMRNLYMHGNRLTGTIHSEIGFMSNLSLLAISHNTLTGSLPSQIASMTSLSECYLGNNTLNGSLPTELGLMTDLEILDVAINTLLGSLPSQIALMTSLSELRLSDNSLKGSLPTELGLMADLEILDIAINTLTGSIPTQIALMTGLRALSLYNNTMTGSIPSELASMTNLDVLYLDGNMLTGNFTCPVFIENCTVSCFSPSDDACRVL